MQTFLPYPSLKDSADCLDDRRLNKQIIEAFQIYKTIKCLNPNGSFKIEEEPSRILDIPGPGLFVDLKLNETQIPPKINKVPWGHHPAVLEWIGYESQLLAYIYYCIREWKRGRGKHINADFEKLIYEKYNEVIDLSNMVKTKVFDHDTITNSSPWFMDSSLCNSHRASLLRKDPAFYSKYNWQYDFEIKDLPYYWPYIWSNVNNSRIKIPDYVYEVISSKGDIKYRKYLDKIKLVEFNDYNANNCREASREEWELILKDIDAQFKNQRKTKYSVIF